MKEFFLTYFLILLSLFGTYIFIYFILDFLPDVIESVYKLKEIIKLHKSAKQVEEEDINEIIDDSFTTQELAEVERFRARLDALRKDKDGLYDVHNVRFDNFTGVETSE